MPSPRAALAVLLASAVLVALPAAALAHSELTLQPIAVAYRVVDGRNVVHRMVDAPWADSTR